MDAGISVVLSSGRVFPEPAERLQRDSRQFWFPVGQVHELVTVEPITIGETGRTSTDLYPLNHGFLERTHKAAIPAPHVDLRRGNPRGVQPELSLFRLVVDGESDSLLAVVLDMDALREDLADVGVDLLDPCLVALDVDLVP